MDCLLQNGLPFPFSKRKKKHSFSRRDNDIRRVSDFPMYSLNHQCSGDRWQDSHRKEEKNAEIIHCGYIFLINGISITPQGRHKTLLHINIEIINISPQQSLYETPEQTPVTTGAHVWLRTDSTEHPLLTNICCLGWDPKGEWRFRWVPGIPGISWHDYKQTEVTGR